MSGPQLAAPLAPPTQWSVMFVCVLPVESLSALQTHAQLHQVLQQQLPHLPQQPLRAVAAALRHVLQCQVI